MKLYEVRNEPGCEKFFFMGTWAECARAVQAWYDKLDDWLDPAYSSLVNSPTKIEYIAEISPIERLMEIGETIYGAYEGADSAEWRLTRIQ
jgi:hypothetical protein